jgi:hypothetical protein
VIHAFQISLKSLFLHEKRNNNIPYQVIGSESGQLTEKCPGGA